MIDFIYSVNEKIVIGTLTIFFLSFMTFAGFIVYTAHQAKNECIEKGGIPLRKFTHGHICIDANSVKEIK